MGAHARCRLAAADAALWCACTGAALWFACASAAWAQHATVRTGDHGSFGRVVFVVPQGVTDSVALQGDRLVLSLAGAGTVPGASLGTRNVARVDGGQDRAVLMLAPGSHPRVWRDGSLVVVDVYGAAVSAPSGAAYEPIHRAAIARPAETHAGAVHGAANHVAPKPLEVTLVPLDAPNKPPAGNEPAAPAAPAAQAGTQAAVPAHAAPLASAPVAPVTSAMLPQPAAPEPAPHDPVATDGLVALRLPEDAVPGEAAILLPFDGEVGAASFRRGGTAHVIFDEAKPLDLAGLKDDHVFGAARVSLLPAATDLALKLPPGMRLHLRRRPDGWMVGVAPAAAASEPAHLTLQDGALHIGPQSAADTVVMDDPATGGRLLVGTVKQDGPGVAAPHTSPEFALMPSWAGVVVAAYSDRLVLRAAKGAFVLANGGGPKLVTTLMDHGEQAEEAASLTRHFDFPPLPVPALRIRLENAMREVAAAPRLARLAPRLRAAQAMLALGMDREAAGVMQASLRDDPSPPGKAEASALLAMAAFLSGQDAGPALADPVLGRSDEITLWRAVTQPSDLPRSTAAAALSATSRVLLAYPELLRRHLARPVADMLLHGGQAEAADWLLAKLPDHALDDLRAESLAMRHRVPEALTLLDKLSGSTDRRQAATAARAAVELRLESRAITQAEAADLLERRLYAWRDETTEIDQRLRVADLRMQAGLWRRALTSLRETDSLFPSAHDRVRKEELVVIDDLLRAGQAQRLAPLDLVAMVEESADLLAAKEASATLAPVLVEKLLALDLPERAGPILMKLMMATEDAAPKASLGARLAALRLDEGDMAGAIAALAASDSPSLPQGMRNARGVLQARALAALGQGDAALAALATLDSQEALEARAGLLEQRKDWQGAEAALRALISATLPAEGALSLPQQDLVLREASAAAQAGDMAELQRLQAGDARRLAESSRSALFQALAQQPVRALSDLPRSAREAEAVRAVPAALASYDPQDTR